MDFTRFALFYVPPASDAWAQFATSWLGWDMQNGQAIDHPHLPGLPLPLADITRSPRKYGLHGTLKSPFPLAKGRNRADLETACADLCATLAPVALENLRLTRMGRFLALCPEPASQAISTLAATCVQRLDSLRALASPDELARRRTAHLSPRQDTNLTNWGYPYVLDDFRFHITLTGRLPKSCLPDVQAVLEQTLTPLLPQTQNITDLALVGEDCQAQFHLLRRFELSG
jgi:putative phosphonate metabolism protein